MLTAMFVNRLGIGYLPLLFIANAGLIILGTIAFSSIVHRIKRRTVLLSTVASGAILLVASLIFFNITENLLYFFTLALLAESIFFAQLNILLSLFIEDLFSPLESQRAFPLIESSEYIGGIVGGLIILFAIDVLHFEAPQLTFIWAGSIALIFPILLIFYQQRHQLPTLTNNKSTLKHTSRLQKIREGGSHLKNIPFLRGLLLVVLLQWSFFTLLNFQYTKAVDESVGAEREIAAMTTENTSTEPMRASGENTNSHENLLTEGLGMLHIGFSLLALLTQLFLTSRVIERLGIIRTLQVHPIISLVTTLGMTFKFGFASAAAAKALFEATTGIYTAAYHSSFYALRESVRDHAKELLEGLIRPLGVILGTGAIFGLSALFYGDALTLAINLAILSAVVIMGITLWRLRERYTHVSKKNLEMFGDHPAKFNSIEILAQRGHTNAAEILVKNLLYKKESVSLRKKILETLGHIHDPKTIPEILRCFDDPNPEIKLAAVSALGKFQNLGKHFFTQAFTQYRVVNSLRDLFERENSKEIRSAIIHVFANMHQADVVPFLIKTLDTADNVIRADCIYVCGLFHDVSAAHYIEPHLQSKDPYVKANAIIALWQFPQYRLQLTIQLTTLLDAKDRATQRAAIHTLGEIGAIQERPRLEKYLKHEDEELRLLAALALAKLKHVDAPAVLAEFVLHENPKLATYTKKHLGRIPKTVQKQVAQIIHQRLSQRLSQLIGSSTATNLSELSPTVLQQLRQIYTTAGQWHEVAKVDTALTEYKLVKKH